jgi:predicted DNA-binding transcriptional regulator YafY
VTNNIGVIRNSGRILRVNRTDRLYALVEELRAAGDRGRTAAWLAGHFEVASRTVKRDVAALQQTGVPIWAQGGPGGGYVLDAAATLPPVTFTPGEATAVAVAIATQPGLPFGDDGRSALTKLLGAMSPEGRTAAADVVNRVWVRPGHAGPAERSPVARTLDEALRRQVVVVIEVAGDEDGDGDAGGTGTDPRPVEPLALGHTEDRWWLFAWCRRERRGRGIPVDRIVGAWLTHEPAPRRDIHQVFDDIPPDALPLTLPGERDEEAAGDPAVRRR